VLQVQQPIIRGIPTIIPIIGGFNFISPHGAFNSGGFNFISPHGAFNSGIISDAIWRLDRTTKKLST
jgi:hypothetical protein